MKKKNTQSQRRLEQKGKKNKEQLGQTEHKEQDRRKPSRIVYSPHRVEMV